MTQKEHPNLKDEHYDSKDEHLNLKDEQVRKDLIQRLRRVEGQIRGIQNMIETGRSCDELLMQLAAVKAAVVNVAMTVLASEMCRCLEGADLSDKNVEAVSDRLSQIFRKFS
ncbi:MAG: metal-sensitive transcriptional regulator [Bacillota bacterium]